MGDRSYQGDEALGLVGGGMYTITANGVVLFGPADYETTGPMYRVYKQLYAWAVVRVRRVRI